MGGPIPLLVYRVGGRLCALYSSMGSVVSNPGVGTTSAALVVAVASLVVFARRMFTLLRTQMATNPLIGTYIVPPMLLFATGIWGYLFNVLLTQVMAQLRKRFV